MRRLYPHFCTGKFSGTEERRGARCAPAALQPWSGIKRGERRGGHERFIVNRSSGDKTRCSKSLMDDPPPTPHIDSEESDNRVFCLVVESPLSRRWVAVTHLPAADSDGRH
ncbi:hypothetical protein JOB18_038691 [Solea senegalensis]|uniref:Uncharacterized protein n=1 Tax=Solea senegalensis TaxID=28829 RepID=A0AAV6Q4J3_SOLSE|nr:hypothetical protein JOB18_038691 [Solea senegalensis]